MENGKKILFVDDDETFREMLCDRIDLYEEFTSVQAANGMEALEKTKADNFDVIVLDVGLPDLDGREICRLMRQKGVSAPIIMLTGHTEMNRVVEARDAGVHEFLAKPLSAKGLYSRIRSILERPRPFIRAGQYFGPDRRRRDNPAYMGGERRSEQPLSQLKIALQCGGSDAFSGISGNPLAAWAARELIRHGGTANLAETDELKKRRALLLGAMGDLNDRERHIITERRLTDEPKTLEELSKDFNISRERVRQIEVRAFEKLQKTIRREAAEQRLI